MPRKIYDIKPPKVAHKVEKYVKQRTVAVKKAVAAVATAKAPQHKKEKKVMWRPIPVVVALVVVIGGVYLFFKLPKADIYIWPKVDSLSLKQTIVADKATLSVDVVKNTIPAQYFQASKTNSQDFPATGNAANEGLASGYITIYNKYSPPAPLTLKAGTHFMADSGKLFIALQKIVIPAATKSGSKITPGSVKVQIQAVEGGSDYNIAPSNFSIPGLKGTAYYYSVYATSTTAMSGGYEGKVKKVSDSDIQGAKDILEEKTTADSVSALKAQISSDYILLDSAIFSNTTESSSSAKSGSITDNFNYKVTVTTNALALKKSDLDQFVKTYMVSKVPDGRNLMESSLKTDYSASLVDVSGGKATLNLDLSANTYQNIDRNSIALSLMGESATQVKETINSRLGDQASKIEVKFWPFWVKAAPKNQKVINVTLKF